MEHLIPITRTNRLRRLSRDGRNVIWVPDAREDIANWREAGDRVGLMVNAGEMGHRLAWPCVSAHGKTSRERYDVGFADTKALRQIPYEKALHWSRIFRISA